MEEPRIGVYICQCGINIAATVDVTAVVEMAATLPGVTIAREYKYMCSEPGQKMIGEDIRNPDLGLNRVVVASCTPRMHEPTFQRLLEENGLNPYFFEMANIREHVSWVTHDRKLATEKAKRLVRAAVARVAFHAPLVPRKEPVTPGGAGGRRRHRWHPDRSLHRRGWLPRLPGRAGAEHRRPHGPTGQDLPHPRL